MTRYFVVSSMTVSTCWQTANITSPPRRHRPYIRITRTRARVDWKDNPQVLKHWNEDKHQSNTPPPLLPSDKSSDPICSVCSVVVLCVECTKCVHTDRKCWGCILSPAVCPDISNSGESTHIFVWQQERSWQYDTDTVVTTNNIESFKCQNNI